MSKSEDILSSVFSLALLQGAERKLLSALPEDLVSELARCVYREMKNSPSSRTAMRNMIEKSAASEFSLTEWMTQIVIAYRWLERENLSAKFFDVVEYVSCALEGSALQNGHDLEWYLKHYGFQKTGTV